MAEISPSPNTKNRNEAEVETLSDRKIVETLTDRLSDLPDSLILHILHLLDSTKQAVTTSALSKRWRYLWTSLHSLSFSCLYPIYDCSAPYYFVLFVTRTLTNCNADLKLNSFKLCFKYGPSFKSDVNFWILFAVRRNVEGFEIDLPNDSWRKFLLPEHLFVNSVFTKLRLGSCLFEPNKPIEWKMLKVLCISDSPLTEDLVGNILSGSPLLESLEFTGCYFSCFNRLDVTSTSLKRLVFDGYHADYGDILEVIAPNILSLDIRGKFYVWKILLLDVSSLLIANLDYARCDPESIGAEEMLKRLINSLHHVKELTVGDSCSKAVSCLEAKGFKFPANMKFPVGSSVLDSRYGRS